MFSCYLSTDNYCSVTLIVCYFKTVNCKKSCKNETVLRHAFLYAVVGSKCVGSQEKMFMAWARSSNWGSSNSAPHRTVESSAISVTRDAIVNGLQKPQHGAVQLEKAHLWTWCFCNDSTCSSSASWDRNDNIDAEELRDSSGARWSRQSPTTELIMQASRRRRYVGRCGDKNGWGRQPKEEQKRSKSSGHRGLSLKLHWRT